MTQPFQDFAELRALLDSLCEETITEAQVQRLEELVLAHPEAEAYYVQYMHLFADLSRHFAVLPAAMPESLREKLGVPSAPAATLAAKPSAPGVRASWPARLVIAVSAVAAAVTLALVLWPRESQPAGRAEPTDNTVAVLLQAPGAVWEEGNVALRAGAPLPPGHLRLKSGLAHIEFYSGATVILEGPADFTLLSENSAFCERGKLRATVPPQAQGFTIGTPNLELVDRGTEFGVSVDARDKTELHVIRGRVDVYDAGSNRQGSGRKEVTTGEAVHLDGPGAIRTIKFDPDAFCTAGELERRVAEEIERRQKDWLAYSEAVRSDPALLVYYTFQGEAPGSRTLLDQAGTREAPHDGPIVGCRWGVGRWPGKNALEFKQLSDRVRFRLDGEYESVTLMAWVRVDALPHSFNSLMMTDGWTPGGFHWQIGGDGRLILGVKRPGSNPGYNYQVRNIFTPKRFGQWTHLAVVYDHEANTVTHYVDGEPAIRLRLEFDILLNVRGAELGNWNILSSRNKAPIRHFSGAMDEFLLFARPLTDHEVQRHYEQGRPPS
jgi:hypothetical protein